MLIIQYNCRFDGIPVLYLPGNSGSHMQARSLASVALRKAVSKGYEYHFDYFTSKLLLAIIHYDYQISTVVMNIIHLSVSLKAVRRRSPLMVVLVDSCYVWHILYWPQLVLTLSTTINRMTLLHLPLIAFHNNHNKSWCICQYRKSDS